MAGKQRLTLKKFFGEIALAARSRSGIGIGVAAFLSPAGRPRPFFLLILVRTREISVRMNRTSAGFCTFSVTSCYSSYLLVLVRSLLCNVWEIVKSSFLRRRPDNA